jgi:hypothetical protein
MVVAACTSKGPTGPSPAPLDLSPRPRLEGVRVTGPDRMAPGESAQFTATLRYSDGSTRDVTDDAGWYTLQPEVVSVSSTGLATANSRIRFPATDSSEVHAYIFTRAFNEGVTSKGGMKDTFVMPPGTYRLGGEVRDGGEPARAFLVQITAGLGAGTAIERCDIQGKCGGFVFYGVAGPTEIRVTKVGYQPAVKPST